MKMHAPHPHHDVIEHDLSVLPITEIGEKLILIGKKLKSGSVKFNSTKIEPKDPIEMTTLYEVHNHSGNRVIKLEIRWKDTQGDTNSVSGIKIE